MNPKVILITGASAGIGRASAELLARAGHRVYGTSRRLAQAQILPGVRMLALDLQSPDSMRACVDALIAAEGRIDVLVNNAGLIGPGGASEEMDIQQVRDLFETNFFGAVQMTNAVLPYMRAQGAGMIINISSSTGQVALPPYFTFYAATKHALEAYTEGLRYELRPFGIRAALIEPGYTSTAILEPLPLPDHPLDAYAAERERVARLNQAGVHYGSPPEEVARLLLHVIRQDQPALRYIHGPDSWGIVLAHRLLPARLFEWFGGWLFTGWKPTGRAGSTTNGGILSPRELGFRGVMLHGPTFRRALRGLAVALAALAAALAGQHLRRFLSPPKHAPGCDRPASRHTARGPRCR